MNETLLASIITGVSTLVLGIIGGNFWKNRTNTSNNHTKVELAKISKNATDDVKWQRKYDEVMEELHSVNTEFKSFLVGLKVLFRSMMAELSDKPELVRNMEAFIEMVDNKKK
jgi:uncharacterized protein YneF (UPF0154 family)